MGRQWMHAKREVNAAKRAKVVTKLVREITIAAKTGTPDPAFNPRLGLAVEAARKFSVSNDTIQRAIKKGAGGGGDGVELDSITFEGMGPHNVAVIVEAMTDNRNRTVPEIRNLFAEYGQFGSKVMFLFDHVGIIDATHEGAGYDAETAAIEAGAQDLEVVPGGDEKTAARFFTNREDLYTVSKALQAGGWEVTQAELGYRAKDKVQLSDEQRAEVEEFLAELDDHDDVQRFFSAID
jgi:YebC/PmpR family DNA-binding regulatory protein